MLTALGFWREVPIPYPHKQLIWRPISECHHTREWVMNDRGQSAGGKRSMGMGTVGLILPTIFLELERKVSISIHVCQPFECVQLE